jgi:hypothetical protein
LAVFCATLLLERFAQLRQGAIATHAAQPRLDIQQCRSQPALLLVAVTLPIDFPGPLLDQAEDGLERVRDG